MTDDEYRGKLIDRHITVFEKDFDNFKKIMNKHGLSWQEVFKRFSIYQNGIEYIFSAPGEMTKQVRLDLNTAMGLINLWIANIRGNFYEIDNNPDISELVKNVNIYKGKPAVCIGSGPSLKARDHLSMLRENCGDRVIFSTAHSLISCLEAGIVPHFTAIVDGSEKMKAFIDHPLVDEHADEIKIIFCGSAHPEVVKRWKGNQKYFFLSGVPQNIIPNVDTFISVLLPKLTELDSGGNSGSFNYSLASYLNCSPIAMIGMDLGYPKGFPYDKTMYYDAYAQSIGREYKNKADMISKCYTDYHHPVFNTDGFYDFVYEVFREALFGMVKLNKDAGKDEIVINCTEGGTVYSEDIGCMNFSEFLARYR